MKPPREIAREAAARLHPDCSNAVNVIASALTAATADLQAEVAALRADGEGLATIREGCTLYQLTTGQWELTTKRGEFVGPNLDVLLDAARAQEGTT